MNTLIQYIYPSLQKEFPPITPKLGFDGIPSADIDWEPNHAKYVVRAEKRLKSGRLLNTVPVGFPVKVSGPEKWTGSSLKDERQYVYQLSKAELEEVTRALKYFNGMTSFVSAPDASEYAFANAS